MAWDRFKIEGGQRPDGKFRIRDEPDVFRLIGEIEAYRASVRKNPDYRESVLEQAYAGLKSALLPEARPSDRFLADPRPHSVPDGMRELDPQRFPRVNRIMVKSEITSSGNLSVTFSPWHLGPKGKWSHGDEWMPMEALGDSDPMRRPNDEILFVKGVRDLMEGSPDPGWSTYGERDDWPTEAWLASRAVLAAYGLAVAKLRNRFSVQEGDVPVGLASDAKATNGIVGLEMVDGLKEFRASTGRVPDRFREATGIAPDAFWWHYASRVEKSGEPNALIAVSKKFRTKDGPAASFTPEVARRWAHEFDRAIRYGLWSPPEAKPVEEVRVREEAAVEPVRGPSFRERRRAGMFRTLPSGGPIYPAKGIDLPDDVREEYGVDDVHALVGMLNEARVANGERPIPQGDFPTNKPNLLRVVRDLQRLRDDGLLDGPRPRP